MVEDPEGTLPSELEAMREVVMVLQETNIESGEITHRDGRVGVRQAGVPVAVIPCGLLLWFVFSCGGGYGLVLLLMFG